MTSLLNVSNGSKSEELQQRDTDKILRLIEDHQGQVQELIQKTGLFQGQVIFTQS